MESSSYISKLLLHHDCVVVPGFGAFIVNEKPARFNSVNNVFYPPSGQLSFNVNIRQNDGLLVNEISKGEKISYAAALNSVQQQVGDWNNRLKIGETVHFQNIGRLFYDTNKKLIFVQDEGSNYILSFYGLSPVQAVQIDKKETKAKIISIADKNEEDNRKKRPMVWYAAALIILLLASGLFFTYQKGFLNKNNFASFVPWMKETPKYYTVRKEFKAIKPVEIDSNSIKIVGSTLKIGDKTLKIIEKDKTKTHFDAANAAQADSMGHFYVIGGCFKEHSNAVRLFNKLKSLGFDAHIINNYKGLYAVAYGNYPTHSKAEQALAAAKNNNENAWVLRF